MEWRSVEGYEGAYEVSSTGLLRSVDRIVVDQAGKTAGRERRYQGKLMKGVLNDAGYLFVVLKGRNYSLHQLVLRTFGPPKPTPEHVVNHLDGVKTNNAIENLVWCTHLENFRHARKMGLNLNFGEQCGFTIHSDKKVDAIRILWPTNRFTQGELAELFGVSPSHIGLIVRGLTRVSGEAN